MAWSKLLPSASARAWIWASTRGVRTQPGAMALTVTPVSAVSRAATFVRPTTPCFEATYAALFTEATRPWAEEMLMIRPQFAREHPGQHLPGAVEHRREVQGDQVVPSVRRETPRWRDMLDARVVDQDIHAAEGLVAIRDQPADLSTRVDQVRVVILHVDAASARRAGRGCASISAGSPNPFSTTLAPAAASRPAIPRPMPLVEPVTMADLPASEDMRGGLLGQAPGETTRLSSRSSPGPARESISLAGVAATMSATETPGALLAEHEPFRRRLDDRQVGDDQVHRSDRGEGERAFLDDLRRALRGVDHGDDHAPGPGDQVHRAAHPRHELARDHPVGQAALRVDLESAQDGQVEVPAADQAEGEGAVEAGGAREWP